MTPQQGDKVRRNSNRKIFVVKSMEKKVVLLETEDRSHQILTSKDTLKSSFKELEEIEK